VTADNLKILTIAEAARLLGRDYEWLRSLIRRGQGPPARRLSQGSMCIRLSELHKWLDSLEFVSRPCLYASPDPEVQIDGDEVSASG